MLKCNTNVLYRIFPPHPSNKLNCDEEGLWSITHYEEAKIISLNILNILKTAKLNIDNIDIDNINIDNISILDMTAGCGGNTLSFCEYFTKVTGIEYNLERFKILENNMKCYNYTNYEIYCDDSLNYINNNYDVFFIDPPWGGPEYKKYQNLELSLSNINIFNIIKMIPVDKLVVLKLPFNYNVKELISNFNVKLKLEIKNIIILYIFTS